MIQEQERARALQGYLLNLQVSESTSGLRGKSPQPVQERRQGGKAWAQVSGTMLREMRRRRQEEEVGHLAVNGPLTAGLIADQFWMGRG